MRNRRQVSVGHIDYRDPILTLPPEAFFRLFSFLPPRSIAQASAVNSRWRNSIYSDSSLFNEIDLTNFRQPDFNTRQSFLHHFNRLIQLAQKKVVKLTLDLTPFIVHYEYQEDVDQFQALLKALARSKDSLQEVSLHFPQHPKFRRDDPSIQAQNGLFGFIWPLASNLCEFKNVKSVTITSPFKINMRVESNDKSFTMLESQAAKYDKIEDRSARKSLVFLKHALEFTEGQVTTFEIPEAGTLSEKDTELTILLELSYSRLALERLDLGDYFGQGEDRVGEEMWKLGMNCFNIKSLKLFLDAGEDFVKQDTEDEPDFQDLKLSESSPSFERLESFALRSTGYKIPWIPLFRKIGNHQLKELSLNGGENENFIPLSLLAAFLSNSSQSLENLKLNLIGSKWDKSKPQFSSTTKFFKLRFIEIMDLNDPAMNLFKSMQAPNLNQFSYISSNRCQYQTSVNLIIKFLKSNSSTLIKLQLWDPACPPFMDFFPRNNLGISFPNLKKLKINGHEKDLHAWFSLFHYPNLERLSRYVDDDVFNWFKRNSPKLQRPGPKEPYREYSVRKDIEVPMPDLPRYFSRD